MFAIIAAILFGLALLFELTGTTIGAKINVTTLTTAGLLCVALHLAGVLTGWRGGWGRRRR